ncbi:MAG: hypothetical protein Q9222_002843 [Ikaeria aurantiellina]
MPETKQLKKLIRDVIEPTRDLGHVDRVHPSKPNPPSETTPFEGQSSDQQPTSDPSTSTIIANAEEAVPGTTTAIHSSPISEVDRQDSNSDQRQPKPTPIDPGATQQAEKMVEEIMTSFRSKTTNNDQSSNSDDQQPQKTPAEAAAQEKAEKMVEEIMASLRDGTQGASTEGPEIRGKRETGGKRDKEDKVGEVESVHSAKPVCEDCE